MPCFGEGQHGAVDVIVDFGESRRIDFAPYRGDGGAECGVADEFAYPVRGESVMDFHAESVVGLVAVVAHEVPYGAGYPLCVVGEVLMEIKAAVEAVGIVHDLLKDKIAGDAFGVDIVFP